MTALAVRLEDRADLPVVAHGGRGGLGSRRLKGLQGRYQQG